MTTENPQQEQPLQPSGTRVTVEGLAPVVEALATHLERQESRARREATWKTIKHGIFAAILLSGFAFYVVMYARMFGFNADPARQAVAVIPIKGVIAENADASSANIAPLIEKACKSRHVQVVALEINSPGGSPNEAERIVEAIKICRQTEKKKVVAVIGEIGASAAYMVSMHADEVVAGRYSIVGSIGAIMRYLDASEGVERLGVRERTYKSGPLKGGVSNLSGADEANDQVNEEMVLKLGRSFLNEVLETRKGKVRPEQAEVLASGRVWTSSEALQLGLIDQVSTMEGLAATDWKDLKLHRYGIKQGFVRSFGFDTILNRSVGGMDNHGMPKVE